MTNIELALEIAKFGQVDGAHHKAWVIDRMVRALLDCPVDWGPDGKSWGEIGVNDAYEKFIADYCNGEDGEDTYLWDEGIAP